MNEDQINALLKYVDARISELVSEGRHISIRSSEHDEKLRKQTAKKLKKLLEAFGNPQLRGK